MILLFAAMLYIIVTIVVAHFSIPAAAALIAVGMVAGGAVAAMTD